MFTRGSGVLLHISSLPSLHGIGDLGPEAYRFVDLLSQASQSYWQVLPLNPTHATGFNSPYFSASAIAGNPLLISIEKLEEEGLHENRTTQFHGGKSDEVDYMRVTEHKYKRLAELYKVFRKQNRNNGFEQFCTEQQQWLDDFALFMTLKRQFEYQPWNLWPDAYKFRSPEALRDTAIRFSDDIEREKWQQFVFFSQWSALKHYCNSKGISIIGDIPIYVSFDSADVWMYPELFKLDKNLNPTGVSGVPPDYFSATGQLWNNPVYNWDMLQKTGYAWWIARMRNMFSRFDTVRIDHFRGLVQYWEVPAGSPTAINGSWQPVPTYELFDTLKSHFPGFPVIAEDLGIITDDVRAAMDHYGFPGMKVLQFAFGDDDSHHPYLPHMYQHNCVVYPGTHDNNTIRGWFEQDTDGAMRQRLFEYTGITDRSVKSVIWTMIRMAQSSVADCAIISAQDLLMLDTDCRMNEPSTTENNWKWRMTARDMQHFPVERLTNMARRYGRIPVVSR